MVTPNVLGGRCRRGHLLTGDNVLERNDYPVTRLRCKRCVRASERRRFRKPGSNARNKRWWKANQEYHQFTRLLVRHGLTLDQFHALAEQQDFGCAICAECEKPFNVDHDHVTGRVRGLLCGGCNRGLGQFSDDVDKLRKAVTYLQPKGMAA